MTKEMCSRCGVVPRLGGREYYCRVCRNIRAAEWRAANPEKVKESAKRWRRNHPEKVREQRRKWNKKNFRKRFYGISEESYQTMLQEAANSCQICCATDDLVVDHDHKTKIVRGILCRHCNLGLGGFRDSVDKLRVAVSYLEQHQRLAVGVLS